MFDCKAPKSAYGRLNAMVKQTTIHYYLAATAVHTVLFAYMSFFFRYRRIGALPTIFIAGGYTAAFTTINNSLYKVIVDAPILAEARSLGLEK